MADQNLLGEIQGHLEKKPLKKNLRHLFCETLHWGHPRGLSFLPIKISAPLSSQITATPVAQLSGLPIFSIDWPEERTPTVTTRRAVHRALASAHAEHLICYITQDQRQVAFTWARKRPDGKTELRTLPYEVGSPARTTTERLGELAFTLDELGPTGQPSITVLTDKLNRAFDVEAVTKKFYQEIANWYFWARDYVVFPLPRGEKNTDAYIAQSLIRLITRLIFCWFMKTKGLIPDDLFNPHQLAWLLKNGPKLATSKETTFYKAILQNLFFATLNQEMEQRAFRKRNKDPRGRDPHRGITNLYRYEEYFTNPKTFLQLVAGIPFLNGGLFECLDKVYRVEEHLPDVRIDGFSDHPQNPLSVPDFLFFSEERTVDLSEAYGEKRYKRATVRGLIHTFYHYNFTVTEATPLDQEVALDPELSGKVFENLLAAYNPETATTARKATGSYYTPREIVNYMVDEALLAYLTTKLTSDSPSNESKDSVASDVERKLRHLFADNDEPHQFNSVEVKLLIEAIDNLRALDPACGSGAFPMGLLHKLVFILGKLDPDNEQWKERQIARVREAISVAERIEDTTIRERTLEDLERQIASIEDAFARNELDYGRKLYLIENCIYGVDIQPIAVQIAKMRFFISLLVDQRVDFHAPNLGIRPLPNLETKFVAANTLIGIERPAQAVLRNPQIDAKEAELRQVRERHFTARTPATKAKYRELDAKLRAEISELLQKDGFPRETTEKLAHWDPYDQNASADFFDPEWMFGIREGFHIVIGNPPYVRVDELQNTEKDKYRRIYASTTGKYDLYYLFIENGLKTLNAAGTLSFITPNKFCAATSASTLRSLIFARSQAGEIVSTSKLGVFEEAANYPVIAHYHVGFGNGSFLVREAVSIDAIQQSSPKAYRLPIRQFGSFPENIIPINISQAEIDFSIRLLQKGVPLGSVFSISEGLRIPSACEHEQKSDFMIVKQFQFERWTAIRKGTYISERDLKRVVSPHSKRFVKINSPKVLIAEDALEITATLDEHNCVPQGGVYFGVVINDQVELSFILGLLNSRLLSRVYKILFGGMHMGGGYLRYRTNFLEALPIPETYSIEQSRISAITDRILAVKRTNTEVDTSAWEREIDQLVYRLYGLTDEEIKIVEESVQR